MQVVYFIYFWRDLTSVDERKRKRRKRVKQFSGYFSSSTMHNGNWTHQYLRLESRPAPMKSCSLMLPSRAFPRHLGYPSRIRILKQSLKQHSHSKYVFFKQKESNEQNIDSREVRHRRCAQSVRVPAYAGCVLLGETMHNRNRNNIV